MRLFLLTETDVNLIVIFPKSKVTILIRIVPPETAQRYTAGPPLALDVLSQIKMRKKYSGRGILGVGRGANSPGLSATARINCCLNCDFYNRIV